MSSDEQPTFTATSLIHTAAERGRMLASRMERGANETDARLDEPLARGAR
jgi:hypothetical protein